jgi:hypothetical protein
MHDPYRVTGYYTKVFHPEDPDYEEYATGFKAMNFDMTCRDKQYEVGQTYTEEGPLAICAHGMHYCTEIGDIFLFYQPHLDKSGNLDIRIFRVRAEGDIEVEFGPGNDPIKCAALTLRIEDEIPQEKLINEYSIRNTTITTFLYSRNSSCSKNYTFSFDPWNFFQYEGVNEYDLDLNYGSSNQGSHNKGSYNCGSYNFGRDNHGDHNCGSYNYGKLNSGDGNFGDYNIGLSNVGDGNFGIQNMGCCNCGNANIGSFNKTSHAIGYFNTQPGVDLIFNKPIPADLNEKELTNAILTLTYACERARETASVQEPDAIASILRQYPIPDKPINVIAPSAESTNWQCGLRIFEKLSSYRTEAFRKLSAKTKQRIEALPNFDRKIFAECTGIAETAFDD